MWRAETSEGASKVPLSTVRRLQGGAKVVKKKVKGPHISRAGAGGRSRSREKGNGLCHVENRVLTSKRKRREPPTCIESQEKGQNDFDKCWPEASGQAFFKVVKLLSSSWSGEYDLAFGENKMLNEGRTELPKRWWRRGGSI